MILKRSSEPRNGAHDSTAAAPRLSAQGLRRVYGGVAVVDDVGFDVAAGEILCLLGPSGCGKSTTLRIVAGVEREDDGRVAIDGAVVADADRFVPPERRGVGLMFQDVALFPHLTARENVAFGLFRMSAAARAAHADAALVRVGLADRAGAYPHMLSGGEQQRVALARALAPRPRALLLDEAFSSLDRRLREAVRDDTLAILRGSGAATLFVTHEPEEAMLVADRIALMRAGRIVQIGTPEEVWRRPADRDAARFFSDVNIAHVRAAGGRARIALGDFAAAGHDDGAWVEVVARPHDVTVAAVTEADAASGALARVVRGRLVAGVRLIEARLIGDGALWKAIAPAACAARPGEVVRLALAPERAHVFACDAACATAAATAAAPGPAQFAAPDSAGADAP